METKVLIDLAGKKFGRWTVLGRAPDKSNHRMWGCQCDCGTTRIVEGSSLRSGISTSCGCYQMEYAKELETTHGLKHSVFYLRYYHAKRRCENPKNKAYPNYGGRGIKFLFTSVVEFANTLGLPPSPKHQVDRIDNDGPYAPWNVKWSTPAEQVRNRRPASQWKRKPRIGLDLSVEEISCLFLKDEGGLLYPLTSEGLKAYRTKPKFQLMDKSPAALD